MEFNEQEDELLEPVSPVAQCFNTSVLSISVIVVLEFEIPIDEAKIMSYAKDLIPLNPLFSSIMVEDINGKRKWKKVEVNLEEHILVPTLPSNLSLVELNYDTYFKEYMTDLGVQELPKNKPLWEIHIINYPTKNAAAHLILKFHHSLGDGYSMMGLLISSMKRADNPSLPLTFPSRKINSDHNLQSRNVLSLVPKFVLSSMNSVLDFGWSIMKSSVLEDDLTPIRSGGDGVEFRPIATWTINFSLHQIKQIKSKLRVTINDVVTGIIFLGIRLYMYETCPNSTQSNSTAIVLLNTRMLGDYKSIEDMLKPNSNNPWGNHFALLPIDIPKLTDYELSNPIQFIKAAQKLIKRKRYSYAVFLVDKLMEMINKLKGPEAAAKYVYKTARNSSISISNMIGPKEKMALLGHPAKGIYFTVVGLPQSLMITMISYMENLRITFGSEKEFIDQVKLTSCMKKALELIHNASFDISI
ncbi:O-acyltransferase WSD1-like [Benincasa hispida]|uniref:O-acyltransferase WSD1-like n=1 Tax=Benincasa hispida TaxID=102211 RepID=UPI0019024A5F|nr:O-acyltransferase WSD1-like [Benincasa hispida]